jgi:hypothetical protein
VHQPLAPCCSARGGAPSRASCGTRNTGSWQRRLPPAQPAAGAPGPHLPPAAARIPRIRLRSKTRTSACAVRRDSGWSTAHEREPVDHKPDNRRRRWAGPRRRARRRGWLAIRARGRACTALPAPTPHAQVQSPRSTVGGCRSVGSCRHRLGKAPRGAATAVGDLLRSHEGSGSGAPSAGATPGAPSCPGHLRDRRPAQRTAGPPAPSQWKWSRVHLALHCQCAQVAAGGTERHDAVRSQAGMAASDVAGQGIVQSWPAPPAPCR